MPVRLFGLILCIWVVTSLQIAEAEAAVKLASDVTHVQAPAVLRALQPMRSTHSWPRVEWHGYLRFRPDWVSNGHLGQAALSERSDVSVLTTSAIPPPLSVWPQNNGQSNGFAAKVGSLRDEDSIALASMRLRLRPTFHLYRGLQATVTADLFDNYVFGSEPSFGGNRYDAPLSAFTNSAQSVPLRIKEAFVQWSSDWLRIRVGRQGAHWGLGIFQHAGLGTSWDDGRPILPSGSALTPGAGTGYDLDAGDFVDRAELELSVGTWDLRLFGDYISEGRDWSRAGRIDSLQWDMSQGEPVTQAGFAVGQWQGSDLERISTIAKLAMPGGFALDWGILGLYRRQTLSAGSTAWAMVLDGWAKFERRIAASKRLVLEAEAVYLRGEPGPGQSASSWGAALKGAFQFENMGVYFDAGVASGDDTRCFGIYGPGSCGLTDVDGALNTSVTGFRFHRNFRVDSLLFRDLIGGVTNAWYAKPSFAINAYPFTTPGDLLGADLSVLVAGAMQAEGTPGNGTTLGTEFALRAYVGYAGLFKTSV
ncbi:MAG: hypothetical protein CMH53_08680, partial [Myxococcales bacterium]|nr:hypothetical protein [Myxococcales bacterium]